jgi:hypothetical protein
MQRKAKLITTTLIIYLESEMIYVKVKMKVAVMKAILIPVSV